MAIKAKRRGKKFFSLFLSILFIIPLFGSLNIQPAALALAESFNLVAGGAAADVFVDLASTSKAFAGVDHAAENLTKDIMAVTGVTSVKKPGSAGLSSHAVIVGVIGESPIIDGLITAGALDVSEVAGKWESYVMDFIPNPVAGVDLGLVIAGSDKRGAVYGIYKISETIGVSPWGFFADSVPTRRNEIRLPAETLVQGPPSVQYRGLFINDERQLEQWMLQYAVANNHTPPYYQSRGAYRLTHQFYVEFFDMILRQYGNFMWPAMWSNSFFYDDPLNGKLANDYGVVVGMSHQEFMNCSDKEWAWNTSASFEWVARSTNTTNEANWTYPSRTAMENKWRQTMTDTRDYETIPTLGLRGLNDTSALTSTNVDVNVAVLNAVTRSQMQILRDVGYDVATRPTNVIIYKEIEGYYNGTAGVANSGWKATIDPNVTVMFCDDNHGNVSFLPAINRDRPGGFGLYYHFDYNGSPRSFRSGNSTPNEKVREQMTMAYEYGVRKIWVTNVGSIKFNESPISYWFKLSYDVDKWGDPDGPARARRADAAREFGEELADDIADIIGEINSANGLRKPDIVMSNSFTARYWDEANRLLDRAAALKDKALEIKKLIPPERMDAYYNLVLHPATHVWNVWNLHINIEKNHLYQAVGVTAANDFASIARAALQLDNYERFYTYGMRGITGDTTYTGNGSGTGNNMNSVSFIKNWLGDDIIDATPTVGSYHVVANGKYYGFYPRRNASGVIQTAGSNIYYLALSGWAHPTSQFSIGAGTAYNQVQAYTAATTTQMCVIPQVWTLTGTNTGTIPNAKGTASVAMPKFTSYVNETRYFEVASTGNTSFTYNAVANQPWIILSKTTGTITSNDKQKIDKVYVSIDWSAIPVGTNNPTGTITITATIGGTVNTITVNVPTDNSSVTEATLAALPEKTFVEQDNYISILATNYANSVPMTVQGKALDSDGHEVTKSTTYEWTVLPDYGREGSSVKVMPSALSGGYNTIFVPGTNSPYLEYNIYIKTAGTIYIVTQWAPTNPIDQNQPTVMRYAVQVDNGTRTTINTVRTDLSVTNKSAGWGEGVEQAVHTATNTNTGGARCVTSHTNITAGLHTIRIYMVNDGLTLQKILVGAGLATSAWNGGQTPTILAGGSTQNGTSAMPYGYLGPPESFYTSTKPPLAASIEVDGTLIPGFIPETRNYTLYYDLPSATAPVVTATPEDEEYTVDIEQAQAVPGVAYVTITDEEGLEAVYTINFRLNPPRLSELAVDGVPIQGFAPGTFAYTLSFDVPKATTSLTAVPANPGYTVTYQDSAIPGQATATVSNGVDSQVYAVNYRVNPPTMSSFSFDGGTINVAGGVSEYDVYVPGTISNITSAFTAANINTAYPEYTDISIVFSPPSGAVSPGNPCVATVTLASSADPNAKNTYTLTFGHMTVGDLAVTMNAGANWSASSTVRFSDGNECNLIFALYKNDKLIYVNTIVAAAIEKNKPGVISGAISYADSILANGGPEGLVRKIFLWDKDYVPLVNAYDSSILVEKDVWRVAKTIEPGKQYIIVSARAGGGALTNTSVDVPAGDGVGNARAGRGRTTVTIEGDYLISHAPATTPANIIWDFSISTATHNDPGPFTGQTRYSIRNGTGTSNYLQRQSSSSSSTAILTVAAAPSTGNMGIFFFTPPDATGLTSACLYSNNDSSNHWVFALLGNANGFIAEGGNIVSGENPAPYQAAAPLRLYEKVTEMRPAG